MYKSYPYYFQFRRIFARSPQRPPWMDSTTNLRPWLRGSVTVVVVAAAGAPVELDRMGLTG